MKPKAYFAALGLFQIANVVAESIAINNHSFEDQVQPRNGNPVDQTSGSDDWTINLLPTGWSDFDDGRNNGNNNNRGVVSHANDSFFNSSLGVTPDDDANDQSFFSAQRDIYQVLTTTLAANTTYTLRVDLGDRIFGGAGGNPGTPLIHLGYGNTPGQNNLLTLAADSQPDTVDGSWVTWTGEITTDSSPAGLGEPLRIEITNGTNVGWIDNLRLDTGTAPLPDAFELTIESTGNELTFSWPSREGKVYDILGSSNPGEDELTADWPPLEGLTGLEATPEVNSVTIPRPADETMLFAVRERDPGPLSQPISVILMAGQSNMLGSGTVTADLPLELQSPQDDIEFIYGGAGGSTSTLTTLQPGSGQVFGPEITFGRSLADANPGTQFAVIKYADSGTDLANQWNPNGGSSHSAFIAKVTQGLNALISAGYTPEITAMLWTQGERDARQGFEGTYEANLINFIADTRTRFGANLPFLVSQLSSQQTDLPETGLNGVRQAQANVAASDVQVSLIVTDSFDMRTDNLHFSSAGQISLGQAFATAYQDAISP